MFWRVTSVTGVWLPKRPMIAWAETQRRFVTKGTESNSGGPFLTKGRFVTKCYGMLWGENAVSCSYSFCYICYKCYGDLVAYIVQTNENTSYLWQNESSNLLYWLDDVAIITLNNPTISFILLASFPTWIDKLGLLMSLTIMLTV